MFASSTADTRTVAVTGATGFLGSAVMKALTRRGYRTLGVDTRPGDDVVVADIQDIESLARIFTDNGVGSVIHAAAIVGVTGVQADILRATRVNVVGAVSVFSAAASAGVSRLIDLSSEEVYGSAFTDSEHSHLLTEDAPLQPVSAYGAHKLATELLSREFGTLEYAAARLSWIYGRGFPRGRPPQPWLDAARAGETSPPAAGGDHWADLLHVDDAITAILALVQADHLSHRAYNVGSGESANMRTVASLIHKIEPSWSVQLDNGPLPGVAQRAALSTQRIKDDLGWAPDLSLEDGLRRTIHGR